MRKFCVLLESYGDLEALEKTINSLEQMQGFNRYSERVILFKCKRYSYMPKVIHQVELLKERKWNYFFGANYLDGMHDIIEHIKNGESEILFFAQEGDSFDSCCFKYIDCFFNYNNKSCDVLFIPVLNCDSDKLPVLFTDIPAGGLSAMDERFPSEIHGVAILLEDVQSLSINAELGFSAFTHMIRCSAERKGLYGLVNKVSIRNSKKTGKALINTKDDWLISCILPICKYDKHFVEVVESIFAQSIGFSKHIELYIVIEKDMNEHSTIDKTEVVEACKAYQSKYPDNIIILYSSGGYSEAKTVGLNATKGKYVCFLKDQLISPDLFIELLNGKSIKTLLDVGLCEEAVLYRNSFNEKYYSQKYSFENDYLSYSDDKLSNMFDDSISSLKIINLEAIDNNNYKMTVKTNDLIDSYKKFFFVINSIHYEGIHNACSNVIVFEFVLNDDLMGKFYSTTKHDGIQPHSVVISEALMNSKNLVHFKQNIFSLLPDELDNCVQFRKFSDFFKYKRELPNETINVMFSFDERLAIYAPVTMISLYRNHLSRRIDIYVVYVQLSEYSISLMRRTAEQYKQNIYFIYCDNADDFDKFAKYSGTFECYFDLFAHIYLPKHLKRVLYLDVDLYVNKDISELYFSDFDSNWLIGVPDCGNDFRMSEGGNDKVELAAKGQGFNSGVLVINLEKFRKEKVTIDDYNNIIDNLNKRELDYFGDQALLNLFMLGKPIKYMSPIYNFLWLEHEPQNIRLRDINLDEVYIFHCGGNEYKPWLIRLQTQDIKFYEDNIYIKKHRITEKIISINQGWWNYAQYAPNFTQLCAQALSYTHLFSVINFNLINKWRWEAESRT